MERTVENIRIVKRRVSNAFFLLITLVAAGTIFHTAKTGESFGIPLGEAVIGVATLVLAFATFYLVLSEMEEGIRNREQARVEAEMDRRRVRLNEMLDGLYAPLYGIDKRDFFDRVNHNVTDHYVYKMMKELRSKYGYLALESLKEAFGHYYTLDFNNLRNEEWKSIVEPLWDEITRNYESLVNEYNRITIPEV